MFLDREKGGREALALRALQEARLVLVNHCLDLERYSIDHAGTNTHADET